MENLESVENFESNAEESSEEDGVEYWSLKRSLYCCVCITSDWELPDLLQKEIIPN